MKRHCALLMILALPLSAADHVFTGRLESLTHTAISIRTADGQSVDAAIPAEMAVPYSAADQVEMVCAPSKTIYDAQAGMHYYLLAKSVRLVRTATPQERDEVMALLSWRPGENLLYRPPPVAPRSLFELEHVRQVNLEYLSKLPNFVADETAWRYDSDSAAKPWRLYDTIEDEIAVGNGLTRQNIRQNGKRFPSPFNQLGHQLWGGYFGAELQALFDPDCPIKFDFAGTETAAGAELLVYRFSSPPGGCFGDHTIRGPLTRRNYNPARTGRILVDAVRGNVMRYQEEAFGYPENFGADRHTITESWDYVKIGDATYPLPISAEFVVQRSNGSTGRVTVEYKNHRHFEAATSVTFGK
jgi:hypothetical protein